MKKLLALLLALVMVLSFAACASESDSGDDDEDEKSETLTEDAKTEDNKTKVPATKGEAEEETEEGVNTEISGTPVTRPYPGNTENEEETKEEVSEIVGKWDVTIFYGQLYEQMFADSPLDSYMDYADYLIEDALTLNFKKNGDVVADVDQRAVENGFEDIIDLLLDNMEDYFDDNNTDMEDAMGMTRAEYKENTMESLGSLIESLQVEDSTWELDGDELSWDQGKVVEQYEVEIEGDEMILYLDGIALFLCER